MGKQYKVDFGQVTHQNADCLKLIVNKTFPLTYNDSLYTKIAVEYKDYSCFSYLGDIPVGAISARKEDRNGEPALYVLILSVLPRYRRGQIASQLLKEVIKRVKSDPTVKSIYLHTPIQNETAVKFYEKHGFNKAETIEGYYKSFQTADENNGIVLEYKLESQQIAE